MKAENAIQILNSRKLITEPGRFVVKVNNLTPYERPENGMLTTIVTVAAMTPYQLAQAKRIFGEGLAVQATNVEEAEAKFQEATNQVLAASRRVGQDWTPTKGELVNIDVDYIMTKTEPSVKALLIVGMSEIKAKGTVNVNFVNDLEDSNEPDLLDPELARGENIAAATDPKRSKTAAVAEADKNLVSDEAGAQI